MCLMENYWKHIPLQDLEFKFTVLHQTPDVQSTFKYYILPIILLYS